MSRRSNRKVATVASRSAVARTKVPIARPGTVRSGGDRPTVVLDDGSVVYAQTLGERPAPGQRVTVEFWPPHGAFVKGSYGGTVRLLAEAIQVDNQDGITTETDLDDLRLVVPIVSPGRRVRITTQVYIEVSNADTGGQTKVYDEMGDPVGDDSGRTGRLYVPVAGGNIVLAGFIVETPEPGQRTYQATLAHIGAAGTVSAKCETTYARMIVEDIGAAVEF